jgi:hypothetical protein
MATFKFNAEHLDSMYDDLFEGYTVTLVKENKTSLTVSKGMDDNGDDIFSLTLQTPMGLPLKAYNVFNLGELFDFLDGLLFVDMITNA